MSGRSRFASVARPFILFLALQAAGCRGPGRPPAAHPADGGAGEASIRLTRVTEAAGLRFQHENGESGRKWFPEWLGGGCAFTDLDGDGWPDIFLANGGPLPGWKGSGPTRPGLYRNNRDGTFTDITPGAGFRPGHYGVGCCVGDYDGDGRPDLYLTGFRGNLLYRNLGNGRFQDVTARAGVGMSGLCTGGSFADYDGDGDLDLYVCRYVRYDLAHDIPCYQMRGTERVQVLCRQVVYNPAPDAFWRNNGNGTFTEVTAAAGVTVEPGRGLGLVWTDYDADGRPDLYVANDATPNFLFKNLGGGRLREVGMETATALSNTGVAQAGMGVASADVNGDGRLDLLVTNFAREYTALYEQNTDHTFNERSFAYGLVEATRSYVGFGVGLPDLDLDGWCDLFIANGHVSEAAETFYAGTGMAQPKLVLRSDGGKRFVPVSQPWTDTATAALRIGRGVAFADYDRDGDVDVLVNNLHAAPDLLRNDTPRKGHWLAVRVLGKGEKRSAVGARVTVRSGGHAQVQEVRSGESYCSQNDATLTFGLGVAGEAEQVEVTWPDGLRRQWSRVRGDRLIRVNPQSAEPQDER